MRQYPSGKHISRFTEKSTVAQKFRARGQYIEAAERYDGLTFDLAVTRAGFPDCRDPGAVLKAFIPVCARYAPIVCTAAELDAV